MSRNESVFLRADGKWCGKFERDDGSWKYVYSTKSKAVVREKLRQAITEYEEGLTPPSKMTVATLLDEWLEDVRAGVSERTWLNRESFVRVHIKPRIGHKKLAALTAKDIRVMYREKLESGLKRSTVKRIHVILNQAMREAVRSKYIRNNPLDDVKPPKQQSREMEVLTPQQVKALMKAARGSRYEGIIVLGATCALRVGEALALRCEDVDFAKGTITVRGTLWRGKVNQPKTSCSRRTLKAPQLALQALLRACKGKDEGGYIFATSSGTPIDASNFWRWGWRPLLVRAGLPTTLTYHQLRHSAASLLLNQGVPIPVVSKYLGHANPSITLSIYAHMVDGMDGIAGSAMDAVLA